MPKRERSSKIRIGPPEHPGPISPDCRYGYSIHNLDDADGTCTDFEMSGQKSE